MILSGDNSSELKSIIEEYQRLMPTGDEKTGLRPWKVHHVVSVKDDPAQERPHKDHDVKSDTPEQKACEAARKAKAFRRIGDMREAAHAVALRHGLDYVWSLDSDVIPPVNALVTMFDSLQWSNNYYQVAFCPYPNLLWLGGLGQPGHPIAQDFLPLERKIPTKLRTALEAIAKNIKAGKINKDLLAQKQKLEAEAVQYPADGNIWEVIAKYGWRRRGWLDHAYPGIGLGAMVPSTWCGYGCTLMNKEALILSDFGGYNGQGTEDVFVIANRWEPAGIRIVVIPHCPCDHFYLEKKGNEKVIWHLRAYHEPTGEYRGHLSVRTPTLGEDTHSRGHADTGNSANYIA